MSGTECWQLQARRVRCCGLWAGGGAAPPVTGVHMPPSAGSSTPRLAPLRPALVAQDGCTPLFSAAGRGHVEAVRSLLAAGANKEATDKVGGTPSLTRACRRAIVCRCSRVVTRGHSWAGWVRPRPPARARRGGEDSGEEHQGENRAGRGRGTKTREERARGAGTTPGKQGSKRGQQPKRKAG